MSNDASSVAVDGTVADVSIPVNVWVGIRLLKSDAVSAA